MRMEEKKRPTKIKIKHHKKHTYAEREASTHIYIYTHIQDNNEKKDRLNVAKTNKNTKKRKTTNKKE